MAHTKLLLINSPIPFPPPTESQGQYLKEQTLYSQPLTRHLQILIPIVWKQYWLFYGYEHMLEKKRGLGCFYFLPPLYFLDCLVAVSAFWWKGWGYDLRQNQTVIHQTSSVCWTRGSLYGVALWSLFGTF